MKSKIQKILIFSERKNILGSENIFALSKEVHVLILASLSELISLIKDPYCSVRVLVVDPTQMKQKPLSELIGAIKLCASIHSECSVVILNSKRKSNNVQLMHSHVIGHIAVTHLMTPIHISEIFNLVGLPLNYVSAAGIDTAEQKVVTADVNNLVDIV